MHTPLEEPVFCEFNYGIGFVVNGVDPLKTLRATKIFETTEFDVILKDEELPF